MHQDDEPYSFHIEHIVPKKHDGDDDPLNLAWSCTSCNLGKADSAPLPAPRSSHDVVVVDDTLVVVGGWALGGKDATQLDAALAGAPEVVGGLLG